MTVRNNLAILSLAGKVGSHVLREKVARTRQVTDITEVPPSAEAITPQWLTAALCSKVPNAKVTDIEIRGGSDGTSSRRQITVDYNSAGDAAQLPTHLFSKTATSLGSRLLLGLTGIVEGETLFYNDIRPSLDIRSPRAYYAAFDPRTYRSIVLLEDLSEVGYEFPAPLGRHVTRNEAEDMVIQMARYHGALWESPRLKSEFAGLRDTHKFQLDLNERVNFGKRVEVGIERARSVMPPEVYARRREIWPATMRAMELNITGPQTLLHQDVHLGNWLVDADGRMGLYDWQVVATGNWALDVAYAMSGLVTDDRRSWERELLTLYVESLASQGVVSAPTFDQAWLAYRQQPFHALVFGLFTIGRGPLQPMMQSEEYCLEALGKSTRMVADLESFDSLA
jgi:hypothetical protein